MFMFFLFKFSSFGRHFPNKFHYIKHEVSFSFYKATLIQDLNTKEHINVSIFWAEN